jgi:hypothetical protein
MSLIDSMMTSFCFVEKKRVADGAGGFITEWTDGEEFNAAAYLDTSLNAKIAEQQGFTSTYTITTVKSINLEFHDVIKRLSDGKVFRITIPSDDKKSPDASTLDMSQATAEKWELTT